MEKLLELLEQDCTMSVAQLATAAGVPVEEAKAAVKQYEKDRIILGYKAIIDWDRIRKENVTALIEVNVTPQSIAGFDRIAERIYQYDEVESMYLMSGAFDLTVIISGRTLREVAQFVGEKLVPRTLRKESLSLHDELRANPERSNPGYQTLWYP